VLFPVGLPLRLDGVMIVWSAHGYFTAIGF
jgi:hypothetical protein